MQETSTFSRKSRWLFQSLSHFACYKFSIKRSQIGSVFSRKETDQKTKCVKSWTNWSATIVKVWFINVLFYYIHCTFQSCFYKYGKSNLWCSSFKNVFYNLFRIRIIFLSSKIIYIHTSKAISTHTNIQIKLNYDFRLFYDLLLRLRFVWFKKIP